MHEFIAGHTERLSQRFGNLSAVLFLLRLALVAAGTGMKAWQHAPRTWRLAPPGVHWLLWQRTASWRSWMPRRVSCCPS